MSLALTLSHRVLDRLVTGCGAIEVGSPYQVLTSPASPTPVGSVRVFQGGAIDRLVYIGLSVPAFGLDSHMIFAFTAPSSPLPHFTLDAVLAGPSYAFHLDLLPRVDLGVNLGYMDEVLAPLTPAYDHICALPGLSPAQISPRQRALMSPWMVAFRADASAFQRLDESVDAYVSHWLKLTRAGLPAEITRLTPPEALEHRDQANRALLFHPAVDPVWKLVERLLGKEVAERLQEILKGAPL